MKQYKLLQIVMFIIFFTLIPVFLDSIDFSTKVTEVKELVGEYEERIDNVNRNSSILLAIAVLIPILGAIAAIFEAAEIKLKKMVTIIASTLILVISLATIAAVDEDYKMLREKYRKARAQICEIKIAIINRPIDSEDKVEILAWLEEIFVRFRTLERILGATIKTGEPIVMSSLSNLHADEGSDLPQWIFESPREKYNLFFLGVAKSKSLQNAKKHSFENAIYETVSYFRDIMDNKHFMGSKKLDPEVLVEYIEKSGCVENTFFKRENGHYTYFTLLKINKNLILFNLKFLTINKKDFKFSINMERAISDAKQLSFDYKHKDKK